MSIFDDMFDREEDRGAYRDGDDDVTFEDCECLAVSSTGKALKVRFKDDVERWVPKSQLRGGEIRGRGDTGTLVVTQWIVDRWEEEDAQQGGPPTKETVDVPNVCVMRESKKAIQIRVGEEDEDDEDANMHWIPKSHVDPGSGVQNEGDVGTIRVSAWIARQKGLDGKGPAPQHPPVQSPAYRRAEMEREKRGWAPDPDPTNGDDDVPF